LTTPTPCPKCGKYELHRSHGRNWFEKAVKKFSPFKVYRCHACSWRGWFRKKPKVSMKVTLKTIGFYILVIAICYWIAKYFVLKNMGD
jgi:hypothetical protein